MLKLFRDSYMFFLKYPLQIITTKDDKKLTLQSLPFFINKNFNINDKFLSSFDEFVSFQDER
ncbi:hypothetical protein DRQ93_06155 [Campylobacter jejuni]|nr:hypothetical protein [Campylobacter jejuni]